MTPQFLREEAARFRGMADMTGREASKRRLLTMAEDFESRAMSMESVPVKSGRKMFEESSEAS
jgi:hypothetical protein